MSRAQLLPILLVIAALASGAFCTQADALPAPLVVMIDKAPTGFVYSVNSRPTRELLLTLSQLRDKNPEPQAKSALLVHEDVTLTMINYCAES